MTRTADMPLDGGLFALRERKRLLDDVWLLALFVLFIAVGVPWYLRILEIDFAPVAWSLFGFGVLYVAGTFAAEALRSRRSLLLTIGLLQTAGVLLMGLIWHWTGSLQNPMFLLVFVLPVVAGSLVLANWHSYGTVLLAVATVLTVALIDAPELRWYLAQKGSLPGWLTDLLPVSAASQPFPSLNAPPTYLFLLLTSFTVLLFTVALMAESVTTYLLRLYRRLDAATNALSVAEELAFEVLRASPSPAALIYGDTLRVAQASQNFSEHFFLDSDALLNRTVLELVHFAYPDVIAEMISGSGGEVSPALYTVDGETRVARVRVEPIHFGGRAYAYLSIQDISEQQFLQTALDTLDNPVIVVSGSKRILCFNPAAGTLFAGLAPGVEAAAALRGGELPEGWWETGLRARLERKLETGGGRWTATCSAARILGEKDALTVVSLRPGRGEQ